MANSCFDRASRLLWAFEAIDPGRAAKAKKRDPTLGLHELDFVVAGVGFEPTTSGL